MDSGQSQLILMKNPSIDLTKEKICVDLEKYVTKNTNCKTNEVSGWSELHFNTKFIVKSCFPNDLNRWPFQCKHFRATKLVNR